jgi:hypothetical protein
MKAKSFRVQGIVKSIVEIEVYANSLEDVLAYSKTLNAEDLVKVEAYGELLDNNLKISSISTNDWNIDE